MTRAAAAVALGADLAHLERALNGEPGTQDARRTGCGLRMDQAAAALSVLTDGRLVSVINAPAGSGKTRVLAEIARAWRAAGPGPVIGITASQSARNTLAAGGIESYNSARFLGHLHGQRGARGAVPIAEGTLLAVDEASMMPGPDLADLIILAEASGGKVIVTGDTSQLQAVQNGGGMSLLAEASRLRPPGRAGAVPRALGAGRQPAAARRRHHRARRVRPARPDHRRRPGADAWTPPRPPTSPSRQRAPTCC